MVNEIIWKGFRFFKSGMQRIYTVKLSDKKFQILWQRFKNWKGSQQDFYFKFVNPFGLSDPIILKNG